MALITCPECGKEVSDKASSCPNCGSPIEPLPMSQCTYCGSPLRIDKEQVREPNGNLVFHQYGYCDKCRQKWDMDILRRRNKAVENQNTLHCPKCNSNNISVQREQNGNIGAGTNKVVIQSAKKSKGCLYWLFIGWWFQPLYWVFVGWWWRLLFGGRTKSGININANKTFNSTIAVCQKCGFSWKI